MKLQQGGVWAVGLATRDTDLNRVHGKFYNIILFILILTEVYWEQFLKFSH